jgi:transcriptional regulator with XRE-family HTH domain
VAGDVSKRVIKRVRQLREKRGLTQEAFAERADIKYKHYQQVETGKKLNFTMKTFEKMAKALGVEPWQLLAPLEDPVVAEEPQAKYQTKSKRRRKK